MAPHRNHVEARASRTPQIEFHQGIDYAVLMLPHQTTDAPLAHLYGDNREVTKYGRLFAASSGMFAALLQAEIAVKELCNDQNSENECWNILRQIRTAIDAAKGGAS